VYYSPPNLADQNLLRYTCRTRLTNPCAAQKLYTVTHSDNCGVDCTTRPWGKERSCMKDSTEDNCKVARNPRHDKHDSLGPTKSPTHRGERTHTKRDHPRSSNGFPNASHTSATADTQLNVCQLTDVASTCLALDSTPPGSSTGYDSIYMHISIPPMRTSIPPGCPKMHSTPCQ
jgi:hypothetical protein